MAPSSSFATIVVVIGLVLVLPQILKWLAKLVSTYYNFSNL